MTLTVNKKTYEAGELVAYVEKLEKENAELKGQVEMSYEVYNDNLDYSYHIEEQLTKAKKIIGEFVEWANWQGSKCPSFKSIQNKAEQLRGKSAAYGGKSAAYGGKSTAYGGGLKFFNVNWNQKRTQNDPDKLTDDVMNDWKEMEE